MAEDAHKTSMPPGRMPGRSQRLKVIRDAVTGEKLTDESGNWLPSSGHLFIRVQPDLHDPGGVTLADLDFDPPSLPKAIDTSQPFPEGRLGGKQWTSGWKRYIGKQTVAVIQAERDAADDEHRHWWRSDYAAARVLTGFQRRYGPERGATAAQAAMQALERPDDLCAIAAEFKRSPGWVQRMRELAERFGLHRFRAAHHDA